MTAVVRWFAAHAPEGRVAAPTLVEVGLLLASLGAVGLGTAPAAFAEFLAQDRAANQALIRSANITLD